MILKIVINEQHKLLPQQEEAIRAKWPMAKWEFEKIPANGMPSGYQERLANELFPAIVLFVSPLPVMIRALTEIAVKIGSDSSHPFLMVNDRREKKEVNGKIIYTVPQDGWEIV